MAFMHIDFAMRGRQESALQAVDLGGDAFGPSFSLVDAVEYWEPPVGGLSQVCALAGACVVGRRPDLCGRDRIWGAI